MQYRWLYPVERYLRRLKSYVRNKVILEGCIAETCIAQEYFQFCSRYLHGVETRLNRPRRNYEGVLDRLQTSKLKVFSQLGKPLHGEKYAELSLEEIMFLKIVMKSHHLLSKVIFLTTCNIFGGTMAQILRASLNGLHCAYHEVYLQWETD